MPLKIKFFYTILPILFTLVLVGCRDTSTDTFPPPKQVKLECNNALSEGIYDGITTGQFDSKAFRHDNLALFGYKEVFTHDARCAPPEYMEDVAVLVLTQEKNSKRFMPFYGIFHLHVTPTGEFRSAAAFVPLTIVQGADPTSQDFLKYEPMLRKVWCGVIREFYPKDMVRNHC